jgi:hypothetical protein
MSQFDERLESLDHRYMAALGDLDSEWQAPEKHTGYTKPSAKLLNMRVMLKGMIKARRFCDVDVIAKLIEEQGQRESQEAASKMQHDYHIADQRLAHLSEAERIGIDGKGETALNRLVRERELDLRPYFQKLDNLKRIREVALTNQKKISCLDPKNPNPLIPTRLSATRIPAFVHSPRVMVPQFTPPRRPRSSALPNQRKIYRPMTSVATAPKDAR